MLRINRNIVECKVSLVLEQIVSMTSINRNIVECKDVIVKICRIVNISINRNIVECKGAFFFPRWDYYFVLIETLWNVKLGTGYFEPSATEY